MDNSERETDSQIRNTKGIEELDYDLLFQILDGLAEPEESCENPRIIKIEPENSESTSFDNQIYREMIQFYREFDYDDFVEKNNEKPKICVSCISFICVHATKPMQFGNLDRVLESISKVCNHESKDDWILDEICIDCLLEKCKITKSSEIKADRDDLLYLWDHQDFSDYIVWTSNLYLEYGIGN